jgi:hypothetical protein
MSIENYITTSLVSNIILGQQITDLNGAQDSVATTATGVAWTKYDTTNNNLTLVLSHNVANATAVHIHEPAQPGSTGSDLHFPPLYTSSSLHIFLLTFLCSRIHISIMKRLLIYSKKYMR